MMACGHRKQAAKLLLCLPISFENISNWKTNKQVHNSTNFRLPFVFLGIYSPATHRDTLKKKGGEFLCFFSLIFDCFLTAQTSEKHLKWSVSINDSVYTIDHFFFSRYRAKSFIKRQQKNCFSFLFAGWIVVVRRERVSSFSIKIIRWKRRKEKRDASSIGQQGDIEETDEYKEKRKTSCRGKEKHKLWSFFFVFFQNQLFICAFPPLCVCVHRHLGLSWQRKNKGITENQGIEQ